jgi:hypothetical protein
MTTEEADRIVKAVEGAERPASVDAALWESTCSLHARLMAMSDEERGELLSEVFATKH